MLEGSGVCLYVLAGVKRRKFLMIRIQGEKHAKLVRRRASLEKKA